MIIQTLMNVATTISISATNPTTLVFDNPVEFVSIGKTGDFSVFANNNKKVIVLSPLKNLKTAEMVVLTENNNYQFKIHVVTERPVNYYQIKSGALNRSYSLVIKRQNAEVYEGSSSLMVKNISDNDLFVNDEIIKGKSSGHFPKGGSLYVNGERAL